MDAKIITHPEFPRSFAWSAIRIGSGPDDPEGRGEGPQDAIQDLLDAEEEAQSANDEMDAAELWTDWTEVDEA